MCTRILNTVTEGLYSVGRNMDWPWMFDASLFSFPANLLKQGISDSVLNSFYCKEMDLKAFTWVSKYSSVGTLLGQEGHEYSSCDGMNERGLVVNALSDGDAEYSPSESKEALSFEQQRLRIGNGTDGEVLVMSSLRWVQYILDCYASVKDAVEGLHSAQYHLVDTRMNDESKFPATFHLAIADSTGDSAVVECRDGEFVIYHDCAFQVVTNQPSYKNQVLFDQYWRYQWGKSDSIPSQPVYTAPGGNSSVQRFERASFYNNFTHPVSYADEAVAQTKSMLNLCSQVVNFGFDSEFKGGSRTIWSNISDMSRLRYYFVNSYSMNSQYIHVEANRESVCSIQLATSGFKKQVRSYEGCGNVDSQLAACKDPFASYL